LKNITLKVKYVAIGTLIPYINNAKKHEPAQIDQLAASITEFGFNNPILVQGKNILAGHGRILAAAKLDMEKVPTIDLSHLSDAQRKAYILADNRLGEVNTSWDTELLSIELEGLKDDGFDIEIVGFDDSFILGETDDSDIDPDEVPETPDAATTVFGDVWVMGEHRIICGDATMVNVWEKLGIPEGFAVVSSPPYNLGDSAGVRDKYVKGAPRRKGVYNEYNDSSSDDEYIQLINDAMTNGLIHCDVVAFNLQMLKGCKTALLKWMSDNGERIIDIITWDKGKAAPHIQPGVMASRFEWIFLLSKTVPATKVVPMSSWQGKFSNVFEQTTGSNEFAAVHGAVFPVALPEYIGGDLMNRCRGMVDCFAGTGTTMIAAERLGKGSRGIEMDPVYVDVAVARWQEYTGKQAILEDDGRTFDELKALRGVPPLEEAPAKKKRTRAVAK